jgi:hypothetical protein
MGHIILKQVIEIVTDAAGNVFALQQRISDLYYEEILPAVCSSFDTCSDGEVVSYFDQIVIDLGNLSEEDLYREESIRDLLYSISRQIAEQLRGNAVQKAPGSTSHALSMHAFDNWLFYMKHGYIRWNVSSESKGWEKEILESAATEQKSIESLRKLILVDEHALSRIVFQHSEDFKVHIVEALTAENQKQLASYFEQLQFIIIRLKEKMQGSSYLSADRISLWKITLRIVAAKPTQQWSSQRIILQVVSTIVPHAVIIELPSLIANDNTLDHSPLVSILIEHFRAGRDSQKAITSPLLPWIGASAGDSHNASQIATTGENLILPPSFNGSLSMTHEDVDGGADQLQKEDTNALADPDGLFVKHAGLVLLHPFISRFFALASTTADGKFIDLHQRNKAVLLLQFLAAGNTVCDEHEMVIAKLLCGVPLSHAIDISMELTEEDKFLAEELLREVIGHWSILKNTSPNGIREGFLQRSGKYYERAKSHFLHVENSSIDILLDHLPWGLGMVKFPWMKFMLNIEWR